MSLFVLIPGIIVKFREPTEIEHNAENHNDSTISRNVNGNIVVLLAVEELLDLLNIEFKLRRVFFRFFYFFVRDDVNMGNVVHLDGVRNALLY